MCIFGKSKEGLDPLIKVSVMELGVLIAKNNKEETAVILPAAKIIKEKIGEGSDNAVLNALLKEGVKALAGRFPNDPAVTITLEAVYMSLGVWALPGGAFPVFGNEAIEDIVDSFISGMEAAS